MASDKVPVYDVPGNFKKSGHISEELYRTMYKESIEKPDVFWAKEADKFLTWDKKWDRVSDCDFKTGTIKWFTGGKLNASVNCLDRHVQAGHGAQVAILWEGNNPEESRKLTYQDLLDETCKFANVLKSLGIKKGDRVCLYMQMIPELPIAMLACARIGAVHSVVFGAFSAESLRDRVVDAGATIIVTQDSAVRGKKIDIPMKTNADTAAKGLQSVRNIVVVKRTGVEVPMDSKRDVWWHDVMAKQSKTCAPEKMDAEDPLFILYTSGSTGKPKGVLHTTAGYLLFAAQTFKYIFDYHENDIFMCTADIGWVTGHSYIVYGPLTNRATEVMFEGVPNYPDFGRFWAIIEKYKITQFYTAPTALRALMKEGDTWPAKYNLASLKLLGTVGEPIKSPEWHWYYEKIGKKKCPIMDTWWQTETGGVLITPLPAAIKTKPGSATLPFFGVEAEILDETGKPLTGNDVTGILCIKRAWPGMMRTVYGDHQRFVDTYFKMFPGKYFTGDGAHRDEDGFYWITGRVDDVINVSGHRLGTAEVEGAIGRHPAVAEAAVVGFPHDIKGTGIYAFVTLKTGQTPSPELEKAINSTVRAEIGPHATPDSIQFTPALPKTRSGKIMRRILRKIAEGRTDELGDTTTLADPAVVDNLVSGRK